MKIQRLYFRKHKLFNDHEIVFSNEKGEIPKITYLVGNNGSGKTHILEAIYYSLFQPFSNNIGDYDLELDFILNEKEVIDLEFDNEKSVVYTLSKTQGQNSHNIKSKTDNSSKDGAGVQKISKVVYSTVEINFTAPIVKTVTSKNLDEQQNPKDKSSDLGAEIPQLLVDIQSLDNDEKGRWVDESKVKNKDASVVIPHASFVNRLERFTSVFDKMFDGQKKFKAIETKGDQKHIVFVDDNGNDTSIPYLSSGEKQIIFRIGYILKNLVNIDGGIILIDEPEISLHPLWQTKFKKILLEVFEGLDVQIIIATHSPYIFKDLDETKERCLKINNKTKTSQEVKLHYKNMFLSPSVNLISYKAFGVYDEMLHTELYSLLQSQTQRENIDCRKSREDCSECLEHYFLSALPEIKKKTFTGSSNHNKDRKTDEPLVLTETLPTFIRNRINHPDEQNRVYTPLELKESIDNLLLLFN